MSGSSMYSIMANLSTIENLSKNTKVWQLAVFIPNHQPQSGIMDASGVVSGLEYPTITYPLPVMSEKSPQNSARSTDTDTNSIGNPHSTRDSKAVRTFALLRMDPGQNPWDLGAAGNWKTVMGNNIFDWLLPIKRSPCCNHESTESQFPVGIWVERLKANYGLMPENEIRKPPPFSGGACARGLPRKPDDIEMMGMNTNTR
jgi:palmitoyltransferase